MKNYLRKTDCSSDLKHHIRVSITLSFSSILRNSTENSEVSFYVSLGVQTIAPDGSCAPAVTIRVRVMVRVGGNFPRGQLSWNCVSLCEMKLIASKFRQWVYLRMYFSIDSSCFIYFDVIIHQQLKKRSKLVAYLSNFKVKRQLLQKK